MKTFLSYFRFDPGLLNFSDKTSAMNSSADSNLLLAIFYALLPQIPMYLIYLVGIVAALIYLRKYPKIAFYTITSIGISLIAGIGLTVAQVLLPSYLMRQGNDLKSIGYYFFGLGIVSTLVHIVTFGLLLIAIFSGRSRETQLPPSAPTQFE